MNCPKCGSMTGEVAQDAELGLILKKCYACGYIRMENTPRPSTPWLCDVPGCLGVARTDEVAGGFRLWLCQSHVTWLHMLRNKSPFDVMHGETNVILQAQQVATVRKVLKKELGL